MLSECVKYILASSLPDSTVSPPEPLELPAVFTFIKESENSSINSAYAVLISKLQVVPVSFKLYLPPTKSEGKSGITPPLTLVPVTKFEIELFVFKSEIVSIVVPPADGFVLTKILLVFEVRSYVLLSKAYNTVLPTE